MAATIDDILAGVTEEATLEDSVITLLTNAMQNQGIPQEKIDAVIAALEANKQKLNDAITANTPVPPQPIS